ncbi:hypothetical protein AB3X91_00915 [Paraburkholderia sp. BR14263]|uniref:hypothetical protein n=1 Tax=unclassified Paraburkholderia TaxID=2615204 RepID=UPI0034CE9D7C
MPAIIAGPALKRLTNNAEKFAIFRGQFFCRACDNIGIRNVVRVLPRDVCVILPTRKKKHASTSNVDEVSAPHKSVHVREEASLKRPSRREIFEALYRTHYLQVHTRLPDALERDQNDDYSQSGAQIAWEIWQAAHSHAIELAAQQCERRQNQHAHQDHKAICRICACDIRALQPDAERDEDVT